MTFEEAMAQVPAEWTAWNLRTRGLSCFGADHPQSFAGHVTVAHKIVGALFISRDNFERLDGDARIDRDLRAPLVLLLDCPFNRYDQSGGGKRLDHDACFLAPAAERLLS